MGRWWCRHLERDSTNVVMLTVERNLVMNARLMARLTIAAILLCFVGGTGVAHGNFGVGFILGDPSGISWKYKMNQTNSLAGVVGFSPYDRFRIHVDYLWHASSFEEPGLQLYYGVGGAIGFGRTEYVAGRGKYLYFSSTESAGFGMRGVIGVGYEIPRSPVELMVEAAPIIVIAPASGIGVDAGVGVRVYF